MLKTVCVVWQNLPMRIHLQAILEMLNSNNETTQKLALEAASVLITHNLLSTSPEYQDTYPQLRKTLLSTLNQPTKRSLIRSCAETCGLILAQNLKSAGAVDSELQDGVITILSSWNEQRKADVFIDVLHGVSRHYRPILRRFARANHFILPGLHGTLKVLDKHAKENVQ